MKTHHSIRLVALMGLAAVSLSSCQAIMQSMWTPRTPLSGESKMQTPATIVYAGKGLKLQNSGSMHISSTFCKFCTDAGKTYRGDLMPIFLPYPSYGANGAATTRELPYRVGQKGILVVGSQSGVVHSFMPYEHAGKIENNRRAWQIRSATAIPQQDSF